VGLTVFKTAEGSLSAVPGGFDSHTPLPLLGAFLTYLAEQVEAGQQEAMALLGEGVVGLIAWDRPYGKILSEQPE